MLKFLNILLGKWIPTYLHCSYKLYCFIAVYFLLLVTSIWQHKYPCWKKAALVNLILKFTYTLVCIFNMHNEINSIFSLQSLYILFIFILFYFALVGTFSLVEMCRAARFILFPISVNASIFFILNVMFAIYIFLDTLWDWYSSILLIICKDIYHVLNVIIVLKFIKIIWYF